MDQSLEVVIHTLKCVLSVHHMMNDRSAWDSSIMEGRFMDLW